jgi:DNA-binding MarR family transcriptional regulator
VGYQQTSLLAYSEVRTNLGPRQATVLDCITVFGTMNNKQIGERLHLPINVITPRVLVLRSKGLVELDRQAVDVSGRRVNFWRAVA